METRPVLYRPKDGAVVAGVCVGLARRWGIDPVVVRIAVAVLSFAGGLGIVAYTAAVLLIPREGGRDLPIREWLPFTRSWPKSAVVAAVVAAGVLLVALLGGWSSGLGPLLVIGLVWYFGIHRAGSRTAQVPASGEPTPFERAAEAWRQRLIQQRTHPGGHGHPAPAAPGLDYVSFGRPPAAAPVAVTSTALTPAPPIARGRARGRAWLVALALGVTGTLTLSLLAGAGLNVPPLAYAAVALGALGLTLLACVRRGRPPLMIPATVLAAIVALALMVPSPRSLSVGEVAMTYTSAADLPPTLSVGMGEVALDLSGLALSADATTAVHVGAGTATIVLPASVSTEIDWSVKAGEYRSPEVSRSGLDLAGVQRWDAGSLDGPTLHLTVTVDAGSVEVVR